MRRDLPASLDELAMLQGGVISRKQVIGSGMEPDAVERRFGKAEVVSRVERWPGSLRPCGPRCPALGRRRAS